MDRKILTYDSVEISFGGKAVVHDVSFSLEHGEILGLVGESGSGKSTLIKAAMGLLGSDGLVTRGDIRYMDQNILDIPEKEKRKIRGAGIGMIFQDAERLFKQDEGKKASFWKGKKKIEVWDLSGFKMEGCPYKLRVVRYHEQWKENGKETERFMWLVTTLEAADYRVLWEMMHRRWDIEENGFHQLKTYYHAKHCYCRDAVETIFNLIIIGFNVRELYLYRRSRNFAGSGISRKSINRIFCDELLTEKVKQILYGKGG